MSAALTMAVIAAAIGSDPRRINQDESIAELFERVRALERARRAGVEYCYWGGGDPGFPFGVTIPSVGAHTWDNDAMVTNSESVFSVGTHDILGVPFHGISIDEGGLFLNISTLIIGSETATTSPENVKISTAVGPTNSNFIAGLYNKALFGNSFRIELWTIPEGGVGVGNAILFSATNGEAFDVTGCLAYRIVIRLDPSLYFIDF